MGKKIKIDMPLPAGRNEKFAPGAFKPGEVKSLPVTLNFDKQIGFANGTISEDGNLSVEIETDFDVDKLVGVSETSFAYNVEWDNLHTEFDSAGSFLVKQDENGLGYSFELESISFIPKIETND